MFNTIKPYQFYSNGPHSWEDIEKSFLHGFGGSHIYMQDLVRHIRSSELANRLFAYKSMDKLVVSNDQRIDPFKDALHIRFDLASQQWHFSYFAVPFRPAEFERFYPPDTGIEKFNQFLKWIRW